MMKESMMRGMSKSMMKGMNKMKGMMKGMSKSMKGGMNTMTNSTDMTTPQSGGKTRKHKVNNVLRAWRMHVQKVAKEENVSYGKEAMQMAKKGKHGQEWARIKMSLKKQKGGESSSDNSNSSDSINDMPMGGGNAMGMNDGKMGMSDGQMTMDNGKMGMGMNNDEFDSAGIEGGRRRKSRKHKRKMSRKSRKSRKH